MASQKPLVLVTGPTGFVGAHVFHALLEAGYRVKGTIRSPSKAAFLERKYASRKDDFFFVIVPDIQSAHALDEAMTDVDYVCHVASPYFTSTLDPIKELVEPAVLGTENVVASALKAPRLKRMTVMSSFAAVVDLAKNPRPGYTYTATDWDPVTEEQAAKDGFFGYHASKTFAERKAWEMWRAAKEKGEIRWDMVAFNPPMVYGPPIHEVHPEHGIEGLNTSVRRLLQGIIGTDPQFAPKVAKPGLPHWVDVRDIAKVHVNALSLPEGTSERFLLCSSVKYYEDGLAGLRAKGAKSLGEEGEKCDPGNHFAIDVSKAKEMLKIEFIPFEKTVEDVWERAQELGLVEG
jgi:nucleoside-diphosphate-sugar epimerase